MIKKPLILICDDDADLIKALTLTLRGVYEIKSSQSVAVAKSLVTKNDFDAAIVDLNFEGQDQDGLDLLEYFGRHSPGTYLIVLSGDSSVKRVLEAHRKRLFEFIYKDATFNERLNLALNRITQLKQQASQNAVCKYMTQSARVKSLLAKVEKILKSDVEAPILITGETGTGKELLSQHIALNMKKNLVAANMASIPHETAESILFGHEKGAFTGATHNKIGLVEAAHNGILFLDEIGECTPAIQAKLLRVLQEKEVQPVGAIKVRKVNVQFIAATHRNLDEMVENGLFRLDLIQRLNTFVLELPSLRERPEDILLYTNLFLEESAVDGQRFSISPSGVEALLNHDWPGNIRELKSVVQRIVVFSDSLEINESVVEQAIGEAAVKSNGVAIAVQEENLRREELAKTLLENNGHRRKTADRMGVSVPTVYRWIKEYGLNHLAHSRKGPGVMQQ